MRSTAWLALTLAALPLGASAQSPALNVTCPGGLSVHANEGGPVYINGKAAQLKKSNDNYYEASGSGVVISISRNPDGSIDVSYTGPHRAHGICSAAQAPDAPASAAAAAAHSAVPVKGMPDHCASESATKFQIDRLRVHTQAARKDHGMYTVLARFDTTGSPPTPFACTYSAQGQLVGIDKL